MLSLGYADLITRTEHNACSSAWNKSISILCRGVLYLQQLDQKSPYFSVLGQTHYYAVFLPVSDLL